MERITEKMNNGCDFCNNFDFANARAIVDSKNRANIEMTLCNTKFSKEEQFKFCPICGRKLRD